MSNRPDYSDFGEVGQFHTKFGLPVSQGTPRTVDPEVLEFRIKFLREELDEFEAGAKEGDHAQMFDALLDLVYVALGTAHYFGYPWHEGWRLVQCANMSKVRAQADGSDSKRGSSFDVVKPPGWTPPDIEKLLRTNGWDTNE